MSLRALWAELQQPAGKDQSPGARLGTAAGHAVLGAAATVPLALLIGGAPVIVAILYAALKEVRDLRSGGDWRDGLIDTAFVLLGGCAVLWPWLWPVVLIAVVADGAYGETWR